VRRGHKEKQCLIVVLLTIAGRKVTIEVCFFVMTKGFQGFVQDVGSKVKMWVAKSRCRSFVKTKEFQGFAINTC